VVLGVVVVCQTIQVSVIGDSSTTPTTPTTSVVVLACNRSIDQATDVVLLLSVE
jgi:hypothetical protein